MLHPMNFRTPTDQDIHTAFEQGESAVRSLVHELGKQIEELAHQLAKQGEALQALQARLAKNSRNSSKPPASDSYSKVKRTESLRKSGDKPNGGTGSRGSHPERVGPSGSDRASQGRHLRALSGILGGNRGVGL